MKYQETICITSNSIDESLDQVTDSISDVWPSDVKPHFISKCEPQISALLVLINGEDDLSSLLPLIVENHSKKIPVIVVSENTYELRHLLSYLDIIHIESIASPALLAGLLWGIINNSLENSKLRSQVKLMRQLQRSLKDDLCYLQDELQTAAAIQKEFMSFETPEIEGITCNTFWKPAGVVSGDMFDITRLDESHVSFFISDSIGHGISAAMLAMMINRTLSTQRFDLKSSQITNPAKMMVHLNEAMLLRTGSSARFATAIYGILNTNTNQLTYAGAGHPPALLSHHDGRASLLESDGPLLGVFDNASFQEQTISLDHGDTLVLYSDGFEQVQPISNEPSETLPLHVQAMHEICITSRDDIIESLVSKTNCKKPVQDDDLTLISIKIDQADPIQIAA